MSLLSLGALLKCAGSKVEKNDLWNGIQERVPTWRCNLDPGFGDVLVTCIEVLITLILLRMVLTIR